MTLRTKGQSAKAWPVAQAHKSIHGRQSNHNTRVTMVFTRVASVESFLAYSFVCFIRHISGFPEATLLVLGGCLGGR